MADPNITIKMPDTPPAAAPGWKSSEFQLAAVVGALISSGCIPPSVVSWLVGLSIAYSALRTGLKAMHVAGLLKRVPDLPDIETLAPGHTSTTITTLQGPTP